MREEPWRVKTQVAGSRWTHITSFDTIARGRAGLEPNVVTRPRNGLAKPEL